MGVSRLVHNSRALIKAAALSVSKLERQRITLCASGRRCTVYTGQNFLSLRFFAIWFCWKVDGFRRSFKTIVIGKHSILFCYSCSEAWDFYGRQTSELNTSVYAVCSFRRPYLTIRNGTSAPGFRSSLFFHSATFTPPLFTFTLLFSFIQT